MCEKAGIKKRNKGSAVVEISLLIPVLLGCVFFYIFSMLFLVEHGKAVEHTSEVLYEECGRDSEDMANQSNGIVCGKQGSTISAKYEEKYREYNISVSLMRDADDIVKNLRRWQFIADTVH